jgi:hypothetical protein
VSRGAQAAWLALLTAVDLVALPFAFLGATLAPAVFRSGAPAMSWSVTALFVSFLLVTILAPIAAWSAFLLRQARVAWMFALAPVVWIAAVAGFSLVAWLS